MKLIRVKKADAEYSDEFKNGLKKYLSDFSNGYKNIRILQKSIHDYFNPVNFGKLNDDEKRLYKKLNIASDALNTAGFNLSDVVKLVEKF